jgi:hypothetical protein
VAILSTPVPSDVLLLVSPLTSALAPSQLVFLRLSLGALLLQTRFIFTQRLSGDTLHTVVRSTGITRTKFVEAMALDTWALHLLWHLTAEELKFARKLQRRGKPCRIDCKKHESTFIHCWLGMKHMLELSIFFSLHSH